MQAKGWEQISIGAVDHHAKTVTLPRAQIIKTYSQVLVLDLLLC